jgi:hypothetical protein
VQELLRIESLEQGVGREEAHQRAGGSPADCVDAGLLAFLGVEVARGDDQARGRSGLVGAERRAPGEGQVEAKRSNRLPLLPGLELLSRDTGCTSTATYA